MRARRALRDLAMRRLEQLLGHGVLELHEVLCWAVRSGFVLLVLLVLVVERSLCELYPVRQE